MSGLTGMDVLTGRVHFTLQVPALGSADYARLQSLLLRAAAVRPGWRGRLTGLIVSCLVGGGAGYLVSSWAVSAELWIVSDRLDWVWSLDSVGIVLAVLGVVAATLLAFAVVMGTRQHRAVRALHAAGGELFGAHELLLSDDGLLWRNACRTLLVPWSRLTGAVRQSGMLFIFADRVSAFWLPEALIAAHPDRTELEALLRQHAALP